MTLDADAVSRLKVKDLQRELKKRGLDTSGLKAVLLKRLQEHLQQETLETQKETQETTKTSDNKSSSQENEEREEEALEKKNKQEKERDAETDEGDKNKTTGLKRTAEAVEETPDAKKHKVSEETSSPQPEDGGKPTSSDDAEADDKAERDTTTEDEKKSTIRIDNFVRPFTLNAVKELVQEFGCFVEEGFWMDAIKTHCFVTYPSPEIAEKTRSALDGKVWPPENGRSLSVKLVNCTAMEVAQHGEANIPSQSESKSSSSGTQATQRPKVTIDEFFLKTETKPVLYYLPLTDEQIKQRKERQGQQPERQPRKRRHRGGRKRNRRARFQRR